jgi:pimeloyl-ACP methyl ester carboxylesterase
MAENAALLGQLLAGRGAAPAVVVGHSYGGGIAVLLAVARPELVRGLVLVGSVGEAGSVNGFDHLLALPAVGTFVSALGLLTLGRVLPRLRPLAALLPEQAGARLRAGLPDQQYAASVSRLGLRMCRSFVAEQRSLIMEIRDVEQALRRLRVPTSILTGTLDMVVPPSVALSMAATVAGAELVTVARAGHFLPRDAPRVVVEAVRRVEARAAA